MRRALILAALLPTPVLADDFYTSAPVASVVLYPQGALQTHQITLDLPAGAHRVLFPVLHSSTDLGLPEAALKSGNAQVGPLTLLTATSADPETLYTPAQRQAKATVEAAHDALQAQNDLMSHLEVELSVLHDQIEFIATFKAPENTTTASNLTEILDMIGTRSKDIRAAASEVSRKLTREGKRRKELKAEVQDAEDTLKNLNTPHENPDLLALPIHLTSPQTVVIDLKSHASTGSWEPLYDLRLSDREAPSVRLDRKFAIYLPQGAVWQDVDLTLSTQRPSGQLQPSQPSANPASAHQQGGVRFSEPTGLSYDLALPASAAKAELVLTDAAPRLQVVTHGVAVTYHYGQKLTAITDNGDVQILDLDSLTLPVTTEIHATPRRDQTAFLVAQLENTTAEPFLGGSANIYRGDAFIGRSGLPFLAAGDDTTLPFGPIEGIRLEHIVANNETGDRGIISTTNTREQDTSFRVTNLTGEAQKIRAFYPLTYSEQEDLEVEVTATPRPDEVNHDDKRGLSVWDLDVAAGATQEVTISTSLSWPEGYQLNWQPW